jgi:bifunctional enzyme CysN/CysC
VSNIVWQAGSVDAHNRWSITGGRGCTIWMTGLSASGKSTIAVEVERALIERSRASYLLDGDNLRHGINADLGFSPDDREENVRRVGEVALLLGDAGVCSVAPLISPYRSGREAVAERHRLMGVPFFEIFVDTPVAECERRDPKGLYAMARRGEIKDFTGIDAPYEAPVSPALRIDTTITSVENAVIEVLGLVDELPG